MQYSQLVAQAYQRISPYIRKTPVFTSSYFGDKTNNTLIFKCECLQHTHSFKVRGAFNKIINIKDKQNKTVITCSGGNHGLAVTYAARQFAMKAIVVVPEFVAQFRIDMIKALGGDVIIYGKTIEEANNKVKEYTQNPNCIFVHPFDDEEVITGQATLAYELLQEVPDIDAIMVSIGGGGLIAGIAQYAKEFNPRIKIYGTQTIGADAMAQSIEANKIVTLPAITSVATSLGATRVAEQTFAVVKKQVEQVIAVPDTEAMRDVKAILEVEKLFVEPASSCNLSALLSDKMTHVTGKKVAIILCGGNFSLEQLKQYI